MELEVLENSEPAPMPAAPAAPAYAAREFGFRFHGDSGEYFRIWIVNVFLSVVTLGIYSAWAKVRTQRWFYAHTRLDGVGFEYTADPIAILKGRVVAVALLALYFGSGYIDPFFQLLAVLLILAITPWLVVRSMRFRAYNAVHRGVRFGFTGQYGEAYRIYGFGMAGTMISFGLLFPWFQARLSRFLVGNLRYGSRGFSCKADTGEFYAIYLTAGLIAFGGALILGLLVVPIIGLMVPAGIVDAQRSPEVMMLVMSAIQLLVVAPIYLFLFAYTRAKVSNHVLGNSAMAINPLLSSLDWRTLSWLYLSNIVAVIGTLGLAIPWAKVRVHRYRVEHSGIEMLEDPDLLLADEQQNDAATGDAVAEFMDVEVGF